jgi:signal transduction histidine kinase
MDGHESSLAVRDVLASAAESKHSAPEVRAKTLLGWPTSGVRLLDGSPRRERDILRDEGKKRRGDVPARLRSLGRRPGALAWVEAGEILDDLARRASPRADGKGVDLVTHCECGRVRVRPRPFSAALGELLDNAVSAADAGGTVLLDACATAEGDVLFQVRDAGDGMSAEMLAALGQSPAGLSGIAFAWTVIDAHGGLLRFESMRCVGTTVSVWLPRTRSGDARSTATPTPAPEQRPFSRSPRPLQAPGAPMLDVFIAAHYHDIVTRTRERLRVHRDDAPEGRADEGIPAFLAQLGDALRAPNDGDAVRHRDMGHSAAIHGGELYRGGRDIAEVVHAYGDVCQVVTELAIDHREPISTADFRTMNRCLDDAIAQAVTEYTRQRELALESRGVERLGELAHELRNDLSTAVMSFEVIRAGRVAPNGATSRAHARSLMAMRALVERTLAEVRLEAAIETREQISVADLVEEVEIGAALQAEAHGIRLVVPSVDREVTVTGDRQILAAALSNLLHNAFKFTARATEVSLTVRATEGRVLFDVADACGGLAGGVAEELLRPFVQRGEDRSGLGLGLAICVRAATASGGSLHVRDVPGTGCVFTLDLPLSERPSPCARA